MLNRLTKRGAPSEALLQLHQRVKILKPVSYALAELESGALAVVDRETAARWIRDGIAEASSEAAPLWPICPRCQTQFAVSPAIEPGRWIACPNPRCGGGWSR